jgi:hypothetical protein
MFEAEYEQRFRYAEKHWGQPPLAQWFSLYAFCATNDCLLQVS